MLCLLLESFPLPWILYFGVLRNTILFLCLFTPVLNDLICSKFEFLFIHWWLPAHPQFLPLLWAYLTVTYRCPRSISNTAFPKQNSWFFLTSPLSPSFPHSEMASLFTQFIWPKIQGSPFIFLYNHYILSIDKSFWLQLQVIPWQTHLMTLSSFWSSHCHLSYWLLQQTVIPCFLLYPLLPTLHTATRIIY